MPPRRDAAGARLTWQFASAPTTSNPRQVGVGAAHPDARWPDDVAVIVRRPLGCAAPKPNLALSRSAALGDLHEGAVVGTDGDRDIATSIKQRLANPAAHQATPLCAIAGPAAVGILPIRDADYIRLVDWAGRQLHPGKHGVIGNDAPPALGLRIDTAAWLAKVSGVESRFCRAIGSAQALLDKAREIGQRWLMVRRMERAPV